jgi:hypothetical protein
MHLHKLPFSDIIHRQESIGVSFAVYEASLGAQGHNSATQHHLYCIDNAIINNNNLKKKYLDKNRTLYASYSFFLKSKDMKTKTNRQNNMTKVTIQYF